VPAPAAASFACSLSAAGAPRRNPNDMTAARMTPRLAFRVLLALVAAWLAILPASGLGLKPRPDLRANRGHDN
jgi:hypothetical protein